MTVFAEINERRIAQGLPGLILDGSINALAGTRARECSMLLSATRPDGRSWDTVFPDNGWSATGEARLYGTRDFSAAQMVDVWMNSPTHREILLSPYYTHCGVGIYCTENYMYIVALFAG